MTADAGWGFVWFCVLSELVRCFMMFVHVCVAKKHWKFDVKIAQEKIFQLQEESTGLCLEREVQDSRSHNIVLAPCVNVQGNKGVLETQLWHLANRDRAKEGGPCCSGIMNWNFLQLGHAGTCWEPVTKGVKTYP